MDTYRPLPSSCSKMLFHWEDVLFFGYYAVYVLYLTLAATQHMALPAYSAIILGFVLPLTAVTPIVLLARHRTLPTSATP